MEIKGIIAHSSKNHQLKFDFNPLEPEGDDPSCYGIKRSEFDLALFNRAKANDLIEIRENTFVKDIDINEGGVSIKISEEESIKAEAVVIASGSGSNLNNKVAGFKNNSKHEAIGIRGYFRNVEMIDREFCELFLLRELMPGGAYITPLPDGSVNLNMVIRIDKAEKRKINLREYYDLLLEEHPVLKERFKNAELIGKLEGSKLNLGTTKRKIAGERFVLAGDAAGLIDILSANGIPQAFMSGKIAAKHLTEAVANSDFSASTLRAYQKDVYKATANYLRLGRMVNPLMGSEKVLDMTDRLLNFLSKRFDRNQALRDIIYDDKVGRTLISPRFYKRLFFGMKN